MNKPKTILAFHLLGGFVLAVVCLLCFFDGDCDPNVSIASAISALLSIIMGLVLYTMLISRPLSGNGIGIVRWMKRVRDEIWKAFTYRG